MTTEPQNDSYRPPVIEFKSCSLTIPVLVLRSNDQKQIEAHLEAKIAEAPAFFENSPVIFDLNNIRAKKQDLDLSILTETVRSLKLIPIGIRGCSEEQKNAAFALKLAAFSDFGFNIAAIRKQPQKTGTEPGSKTTPPPTNASKIVSKPIRSGQRIYSSGDLIITSQVSPGSEIMAEGNIHVYGTLRGRALAGVKGNTECRIFCCALQAELVSIAGIYKACEELDIPSTGKSMQISLQNQKLSVNAI